MSIRGINTYQNILIRCTRLYSVKFVLGNATLKCKHDMPHLTTTAKMAVKGIE
ncbi:hypothetical protein BN1088_1432446 [Sphingobacterium sp. PM2-P1-29]|nr:hypothetical protein BN1088_1432446 [Sphingobacterium sp. PM2-P1-29]